MSSPSPRQIDPRGHRFGGGLSAAVLVLAFGPALFDRLAAATARVTTRASTA